MQTAYFLQCFFEVILGKFQHNIKISIKTARVSRLSVSYDYGKTEHLTFVKLRTT